jgi:hypothetical protein
VAVYMNFGVQRSRGNVDGILTGLRAAPSGVRIRHGKEISVFYVTVVIIILRSKRNTLSITFGFLKTVVNIVVFCGVITCSSAHGFRRFGSTYCVCLHTLIGRVPF